MATPFHISKGTQSAYILNVFVSLHAEPLINPAPNANSGDNVGSMKDVNTPLQPLQY